MTKQCLHCSKTFQIETDDQAFYDKLKVPAPTLCPDCRMQRRLAWRNERFYYQRKCDKTGEPIISIYAPTSPIKRVYKNSVWFGDSWDAMDYGRDFDFSRPFFEQFAALMYDVPHVNLWNWDCDNAEYNHCCYKLKNSYMNSSTDKSEDSYYSYVSVNNRSVADCTAVEQSELAIECIDSDKLYRCAYCQLCRNCLDTYASYDCHDCKYVFGSSGLRHKDYYIFNQPVTPEQWQAQIPKVLSSYSQLQAALHQARNVSLSMPRLFTAIYNSEGCTGNYIWNSRNCQLSFDARECENLKYAAYTPWSVKDSMDIYANGDGELLYDANFGAPAYNSQFCFWLKNIRDSQYCILCVNGCSDLFGCVGLKKKQYCIFNKQYAQAAYERLRKKIIQQLRQTKEYGELFPAVYSPFGYNETAAHVYYPLTKADVVRNGWRWQADTGGTFGKETIQPADIPDAVTDTTVDILKQVLKCLVCNRNYQIIVKELELYQQVGVALPRQCPNCRHLKRIALRNPRRLWHRQCMCNQIDHTHTGKCSTEFETTYSPERKEIVYCELCYTEEIY